MKIIPIAGLILFGALCLNSDGGSVYFDTDTLTLRDGNSVSVNEFGGASVSFKRGADQIATLELNGSAIMSNGDIITLRGGDPGRIIVKGNFQMLPGSLIFAGALASEASAGGGAGARPSVGGQAGDGAGYATLDSAVHPAFSGGIPGGQGTSTINNGRAGQSGVGGNDGGRGGTGVSNVGGNGYNSPGSAAQAARDSLGGSPGFGAEIGGGGGFPGLGSDGADGQPGFPGSLGAFGRGGQVGQGGFGGRYLESEIPRLIGGGGGSSGASGGGGGGGASGSGGGGAGGGSADSGFFTTANGSRGGFGGAGGAGASGTKGGAGGAGGTGGGAVEIIVEGHALFAGGVSVRGGKGSPGGVVPVTAVSGSSGIAGENALSGQTIGSLKGGDGGKGGMGGKGGSGGLGGNGGGGGGGAGGTIILRYADARFSATWLPSIFGGQGAPGAGKGSDGRLYPIQDQMVSKPGELVSTKSFEKGYESGTHDLTLRTFPGGTLRLAGAGSPLALEQIVDAGLELFEEETRYRISSGDDLKQFYRAEVGVFQSVATPVFTDNFEIDQGWTLGGSLPVGAVGYQLGVPSSGPGAAVQGSQCFGTRLAGSYANFTVSTLTSPLIDLAGKSDLVLSYWEWWSLEDHFDTVTLELLAEDNSVIKVLVSAFPRDPATSDRFEAKWIRRVIPMPDNQGQVRLRFTFRSDGSGTDAGHYLDLVSIYEVP